MPVGTMTFRTERMTDGKIALDSDKTTPVFSPFSGRVVKVFAKLGDYVRQGAPLFALEATELVQGESDLLAAGAALDTARS
jgi:cobalt-zinc-cadmium efflux system membrane fusion protein